MKNNIQNTKTIKPKNILIGIGIIMTIFSVGLKLISLREIPFPNARLFAEKSLFKADESPKFKLDLGEKTPARNASQSDAGGKNNNLSLIQQAFAENGKIDIAAGVLDNKQRKTFVSANVVKTGGQTYSIEIPSSQNFKPGKYTLETTIKTENGQQKLTQDFTWGVLALNPDKAVYNPGEISNIAIAVLDEKGNMVCDAKVELRIKNEELGIDNVLSTQNGKIKVNKKECQSHEYTLNPDYETSFEFLEEGTYTLNLSATTINGNYQIQDVIKVSKSIDFDIERSSATRLYPKNQYPMTIDIKTNINYKGIVEETIPSDFVIIKSKMDNKTTDYAAKIIEKNNFKILQWQVDWKKGQNYKLSYLFDAPDISPEFYLIGNLVFLAEQSRTDTQKNAEVQRGLASQSSAWFSEGRYWQLANDAIVTTLTSADTSPWNVPSDWNDLNNTIEVVGPGGSGATSVSVPGGGGGGGAYASVSNLNLTEGGTANFQIGTGGSGTATWFSASGTVNAGAGGNASGITHGNGGTATAGTTQTAGGNGGDGGNLAGAGGGGGGGAAGPNGAGHIGGSGIATGATGGGGGGGNGGGTGTNGSSATGTNGANGGNGNGGTGGGTGGAGVGGNATANTGGGGAGGAGTTASGGAFAGGTGAAGSDISGATTGTGGGGGGGGGNTRTAGTGNDGGGGGAPTANTGAGGGGGGDCTDATCAEGAGQTGANGFIVVTYTPAGVNVSGNVYSTGTTPSAACDANAGTFELSLRANGVTYTASCSNTDGSYTFTGVLPGAAGNGIIIWINDLATDGAIAIRYDGAGDSTSNIFYDNAVTVTSDDTNGVTNSIMNTYDADTGDVDIPYVVTTNNLTASSGAELLVKIKSGVTGGSTVYAPGGTVTTNATGGDFHIDDNSAASLDTATSAIGRDILIDTGATLTISASATVGGGDITATGTLATSGTPTVTIRGTGSISGAGTKTIYNLIVGDATVATTTLSDTLSISNNASVGTGSTFNINADLTVTGNLTNTTTGIINHTANSPVVTVSGTSIGGGSGAITFYRLQKAGAGTTTFSGSGTNTINNTLDATAGTLTLSTNNVITVAGNVSASTSATLNQNTSLTINGGSLLTSGTGVVGTTAGTGTVTITGTGNIGGGGAVTVYALAVSGSQTAQSTITANNSISVGSSGTFTLTGQNINSAGNFTNTTTGVIACSGTTGTVTMTGGGNLGGGSGAITFCNLSTTTTGTTNFSGSGTNTVNNNVSVGASTTLSINSNLSVGSSLTNSTSGIITYSGTPTITMTGTGSIGGGTTGTISIYALTTSGTGTTTFTNGGTNSVANNISVGAGTTLNINSSVSVAGSLTNATSGVIGTSAGTPTVTLTGTGSIGGGTTGAITFYALATSGTGTYTFTNGGTNIVNNNVSVGAGTTLNLNSDISITGNLTNATSGVIGTSAGTPTVTVSGTSIGGGTTGAITFYNLTKAGAGTTTFANSGTNTINNDLSVSNGTFTQSDVLTITGTAAVLTGATFNTNANLIISGGALTTAGTGVVSTTAGAGTVTINGTGGNIGGGGTVTVYNLTLGGSGTQTLQSGTTANNDVSVGTGKTLSLNNQNLTVSGGDLTTTSTGIISCSGTTGTATVNGTAATGIGGGADTITFCNLTIGGTVPIASAITVNNDMTNNGTTSGSVSVTVNGNVVGTGSINMTSGTFKQRVATGKNFGTTSTASTWTFSTLTLSNSSGSPVTITTQSGGSGTITASALNIGEGGDTSTTTLDAANRSFVISGGGTPVTINGSSGITASTSTFTYTGTGSVNLANISYYSLATNGSGTYLPASSPLIVTNNVTVTLGTLSLGTNDLNVGSSAVANSGGISVAGTLSQSASATTTIVSSSAGTATIGGAGTITFYNLTFAPTVASAPTFTLGSAASQTITVNNDLTIGNGTNPVIVTANTNNPIIDLNGSLAIAASGTLTAPPSALFTIAKNMTNNGTFNNNSGTVTFDTTNTSVFDGSATPAIQFNNFTSIIPNKTLSFTAAKTFRIDGVFTVTGTLGNRINIQSTTGTQWLINLQGTSSVTSATITNSGCAGGTLNVTLNTSNADGGNNGACWIFSGPGVINSSVQGNTRIQGNVRFK